MWGFSVFVFFCVKDFWKFMAKVDASNSPDEALPVSGIDLHQYS